MAAVETLSIDEIRLLIVLGIGEIRNRLEDKPNLANTVVLKMYQSLEEQCHIKAPRRFAEP